MTMSFARSSLLVVAGTFSTAALAQGGAAPAKQPFELHGYIHLKLSTAPAIWDYTPTYDSYWNTMGREGSKMGWIRLAPTFNLANDARVVTEIESTTDGFTTDSGEVFDFNKGSAYLEMPIATDAKVWFGRRRFEINQQRWSDGKPFNPSPDRLNGGGLEFKLADIQFATTLGLANFDLTYDNDADATKYEEEKLGMKKVVFIQQANMPIGTNGSLAPLLIVDYIGKDSRLEAQRDAIKALGNDKTRYEADQRANYQLAVGYTSWGEGWWNNLFAGAVTRDAIAGTAATTSKIGRSDRDLIYKVGTQGGYNALRQAANLGLYYGARVDLISYKNDMQQNKITDGKIVADGVKKTKQGTIAALSVQPVYYVTEQLHGAFDVTYTSRSLVADGAGASGPYVASLPSSLALSPTIRYANKAEPIALPQIYAGLTYTKFNAEHPWLSNAKGKPVTEMTTFQAGFEADF